MNPGDSPARPQRRECYCAARACGYGPSSAYTMAGYASPDRISASRNAQRLEQDETCRTRIAFLTARPELAATALAKAQTNLNKKDAQDRNRALKNVMKARKKEKSKREVPIQISPPHKADVDSLTDLLELILDESRALVDRCRRDSADTIVTKSAIDLHRSATSARERFLSMATEADNQSSTISSHGDMSALQAHTNMQRQIGDVPTPLPKQVERPETTIADTRDEEHLRYNIAVSFEQIDNLSIGKIPSAKDQIRLYEALLKSVVKLSQILSHRAVNTQNTASTVDFFFDPKVFLRWAEKNEIAQ
ncbi:hypothetical protein NBRC116598_41480 [Pseudophaeobacter arcticus]|uniref:Uncharacterized protein n=2 Tax=Pseudophaeobacter arcticus TaxID=385492 RepID=A0ABQ0AS53_9RHOB